MDPEENKEVAPADDEAELDAIINADIEKVKGGEELDPNAPKAPVPAKPEEKPADK